MDESGFVVNKGMATGLPVLGSVYSQAVDQMVREGKTGWRLFPRKTEAMQVAIDRALSTPLDRLAEMRAQRAGARRRCHFRRHSRADRWSYPGPVSRRRRPFRSCTAALQAIDDGDRTSMEKGQKMFQQIRLNNLVDNPSKSHAVSRLISALRRQAGVVIAFCVLGTSIGIVYVVTATPLYTASVNVMIDNRELRAVRDVSTLAELASS